MVLSYRKKAMVYFRDSCIATSSSRDTNTDKCVQIILILPESTKQHQCLLVRPSEARNPTILTKIASRPINKALIWAGPNDLVRFSCGVSCFVAHHRHRLLLVGVGARAFSLLHVLALSCVARSCKFCRGARSGHVALGKNLGPEPKPADNGTRM